MITLRTAIAGQSVSPEKWYRNDRPCVECRANVLKRVERNGVVYIDVAHPDSCSEGKAAVARADGALPRQKTRGTRPSPRRTEAAR